MNLIGVLSIDKNSYLLSNGNGTALTHLTRYSEHEVV